MSNGNTGSYEDYDPTEITLFEIDGQDGSPLDIEELHKKIKGAYYENRNAPREILLKALLNGKTAVLAELDHLTTLAKQHDPENSPEEIKKNIEKMHMYAETLRLLVRLVTDLPKENE